MRRWLVLFLLSLGAAAYLAMPGLGSHIPNPCDRYASPAGSDAATGSQTAPYRTVGKLVQSLTAGQTGCLRGRPPSGAALYETNGLTISTPNVTLRAFPHEVAHLKGLITVGAADVTLTALVLDGRNSIDVASPVITGNRARLLDNVITTRRTTRCVQVLGTSASQVSGVRIEHNRIEGCDGEAVTLEQARSTVVADNLIYETRGAGVRMHPNADSSSVLRNVIDSNGNGLVFGTGSEGNFVSGNTISNPQQFTVTATAAPGEGNYVASNCVYKPPSGNGLNTAYVTSSYGPGRIVAYDNVTANPSYASDYTVPATSACRSRTGDMSAAASDGNDRPTLAQAVNLRPNVLFIVSDDQAADTAIEDPYDGWANPMPEWAMGKTRDWFRDGRPGVAGGTEYSQAYATTPLCCPSRSSILSGQYAHNHDVQKNSQAITNLAEPLLSEYLAGAGYQTALYGKFLMDYTLSSQPVRGFREFGIFDLGYNRIPVREGTTSASGQTTSSTRMLSQYTTSYVRDQALAFLRRQNAAAKDGQPWFLYLAPFAPHELQTQAGNPPYPPGVTSPTPNFRYGPEAFQDMTTGSAHADDTPPPFEPRPAHHEPDRSDKPQWVVDNRDDRTMFEEPGFPGLREQQLRALRDVDDLVEAVFQELQAEGEGDETLAVYLSDNGYMWREHSPTVKATGVPNECYTDLHESDPPYPGHDGRPPRAPVPCGVAAKGIPYLNSIHVPMFVRWPGNPSVPRGVTDRNLTANVDLAPTVMDALGKTGEIPAAEPMDGRPLFGGGVRSMLLTEGWPQIGRPAWASVLTPPHVAGAYHYIWSETQPAAGDPNPPARLWEEWYDISPTEQSENDNRYGPGGVPGGAGEPPVPVDLSPSGSLRKCRGNTQTIYPVPPCP